MALENLTGTPFFVFNSANPMQTATYALEMTWDQVVAQVATRFLSFIPLKPLVDAYEDVFIALDCVQSPENLTQAQVNALLDPILNPAQAAFDAHPLKWAAELQYDYATDGFTGSIDKIVDSLATMEPAGSAAKQDFWFENIKILQSMADSQGLTNTQFETAIAGTYLGNMSISGADWRSDGLLLGNSAANTLVGSQGHWL